MKNRTAPKVGFVSLGCPKALVDSEQILSRLRAEGYEISSSYADSNLVVINTCGFIDSAIEESLDTIGEAMQENGRVVVTGCLGAKGNIVRENYPDVLAVTGPHAADQVLDIVHDHLPQPHDPYTSLLPPGGIKLTPRHYAYLKIAEGCNHRCSFCIIPSLRGDLVSRPVEQVLAEAEQLVRAGVKELLVVSQDTSAYGIDLKYRTGIWRDRAVATRLYDLCEALGHLGVWVRLHYVYPYPHVDDILPLMVDGAVLPYLDVPFQHASPTILKAMRRPASRERNLERIQKWRSICPELVIRSTFIVGFPGETDGDFEDLLEFLGEAQLDRVGCFAYSPVDGAKANQLPDAVPAQLKQERLEQFMYRQAEISRARLQAKIDTIQTVIVDGLEADHVLARTRGDAPEIDGQVYVQLPADVEVGQLLDVRITAADEHDLWAKLETE